MVIVNTIKIKSCEYRGDSIKPGMQQTATAMTYQELTIHQKINCKANAATLTMAKRKSFIARVSSGDPQRFGNPDRLPMKDNSRFDLGWNQSYH